MATPVKNEPSKSGKTGLSDMTNAKTQALHPKSGNTSLKKTKSKKAPKVAPKVAAKPSKKTASDTVASPSWKAPQSKKPTRAEAWREATADPTKFTGPSGYEAKSTYRPGYAATPSKALMQGGIERKKAKLRAMLSQHEPGRSYIGDTSIREGHVEEAKESLTAAQLAERKAQREALEWDAGYSFMLTEEETTTINNDAMMYRTPIRPSNDSLPPSPTDVDDPAQLLQEVANSMKAEVSISIADQAKFEAEAAKAKLTEVEAQRAEEAAMRAKAEADSAAQIEAMKAELAAAQEAAAYAQQDAVAAREASAAKELALQAAKDEAAAAAARAAEQTAAQQAEAAPATPGAKGKTLRHKLALGKQHLLNLENQLHQTLMAGNVMDKTHVDRAVYLMQQVGAQQGHVHALEESVSQLLEGDGPVGGEVVSTVSTRSSELAQRLLLRKRRSGSTAANRTVLDPNVVAVNKQALAQTERALNEERAATERSLQHKDAQLKQATEILKKAASAQKQQVAHINDLSMRLNASASASSADMSGNMSMVGYYAKANDALRQELSKTRHSMHLMEQHLRSTPRNQKSAVATPKTKKGNRISKIFSFSRKRASYAPADQSQVVHSTPSARGRSRRPVSYATPARR